VIAQRSTREARMSGAEVRLRVVSLFSSRLFVVVPLLAVIACGSLSTHAAGWSETRARAFDTPVEITVGQRSSERPGSVGCLRPSNAAIVVGACVATEAAPTLRGTSVRGQVTSRPGSFRQGTLQDAWDEAPVGPSGGRVCTSCGTEVHVPPNTGVPRDWDGSHNPSWSNPGCNRPPGNNDTRFGVG
jgi:hypothetical protein